MGSNPHANGGLLIRDLRAAQLPRLRRRRSPRPPAASTGEATRRPGASSSATCCKLNAGLGPTSGSSRPDETTSNRWGDGVRGDRPRPRRPRSSPRTTTSHVDGRVMEMLSEHQCEGWLEGYLLTGRHGFFSCYEAFIHIVDAMFNQHAKWLESCRQDPLAAADRVVELSAQLARLAAGPQRIQPPGPRVHRPRDEQEAERGPRLPGRPTPTLYCR